MTIRFKNILLTGEPGVGKTTIIQTVLGRLSAKTGGFYTQEIKSGKTRKGFQLITLKGDQATLAHIQRKSSYKVGKYNIDLSVMTDLAVPAIDKALKEDDIVLIDEIGKMECFSIEFRDIVMRCLSSPKPVFGTIQNFASPFINQLTNRDDIVRISVTESNRDELPDNIIELFKRILPASQMPPKRKKR